MYTYTYDYIYTYMCVYIYTYIRACIYTNRDMPARNTSRSAFNKKTLLPFFLEPKKKQQCFYNLSHVSSSAERLPSVGGKHDALTRHK